MCLCPKTSSSSINLLHTVLYSNNESNNTDMVPYTSRNNFDESSIQVSFGYKIYNGNL